MKSIFTFFGLLFILNGFGQVYILNEDFTTAFGTTPPFEWSNYKIIGSDTDLWHFDNPGGRVINYPITSPFAIFDADSVSGNGQQERVALESPFFDASISNFILLKYDQTFLAENGAQAIIEAFNGNTWQEITRFTVSTTNSSPEIIDISPAVGGITNAKIRFIWEGQSQGYWALDNVSIFAPLPVDGGLVKLDSPLMPFNTGLNPIKVTLGNFGFHNLTSTTIKWMVNGVRQPDYHWSGNLSIGNVQEDILIGSYNFGIDPAQLKIWQSFPNGIEDPNPTNDSIVTLVRPSLCGSYTIGGANPDFSTFTEAVTVLNTAGISCPVLFNVRDGQYNEQFIIKSIPGVSEINTVSFQSESGDSMAVMIIYNSHPYAVVKLKDANYINFKGIGFNGYHGLWIEEHSSHINLEHCYFTSGAWNIGILSGSHDIRISASTFFSGDHGLVLTADWVNRPQNIEITNNVFQSQNYTGIYVDASSNVVVKNNQFKSDRMGIRMNSTRNAVIRDNRFDILTNPERENKGIRLESSDTMTVYNNYIYTHGNSSATGIWINGCSSMGIYFNSLNITNTDIGEESQGLWLQNGSQNQFKNNIFNIKTAGYPAWIMGGTTGFTLDYNDYFSPSGLIGKYADTSYSNLQAWRQATEQDVNSYSENPFYTSDTVLSMNQVLLNNQGIPIDGILYDIDYTFRNVTQPDLGAKEYDPCQPDAGINRITAPTSPVEQGGSAVKIILQNQGSDVLYSAIIHWRVNGILQPPYTWAGTLPVRGNTEVNIGSYTFTSGLFSIETWTSQPNSSADCNHYNDTTLTEVAVSLCGTYTIGGANPDFSTFTEAVTVLNTAGISCPVLFNVRDGQYNEQFIIKSIPGVSEINTVSFQSESGDSMAVMIIYNSHPYAVVKLKDANYINFKGIGFNGYHGLWIEEHSSHINLEHCYFTSGAWNIGILSGSHDIRISASTFFSGDHGLVLTADWVNRPQNIEITNNVFQSQNYTGIYVDASSNVVVKNNQFKSDRMGIRMNSTRNAVIRDNRFDILTNPERENKGIRLESSDTMTVYRAC